MRATTSISSAKPDPVFLVKKKQLIMHIILNIILISGIELNWKESIGGKVTRISEPDLPDGVVEKISLTVKVNEFDSDLCCLLNTK